MPDTHEIPLLRPALPPIEEIEEGYKRIAESGVITNGRFVKELEAAVRMWTGCGEVTAVSSCTSGLMMVWRCLTDQRDLGRVVIVPAFTFGATVTSLLWHPELKVVLCDVDRNGLLCPKKLEQLLIEYNGEVGAVVCVDVFGYAARYNEYRALMRTLAPKALLVADSAQSLGACYYERAIGAQADFHVFSMSPSKVITAGEGGIVVDNSATFGIPRRTDIKTLRNYGKTSDTSTDIDRIGLSARMSEFNAMIGYRNFLRKEILLSNRWSAAEVYDCLFRDTFADEMQDECIRLLPGIWPRGSNRRGTCNYYVVCFDSMAYCVNSITRQMAENNIAVKRYFTPSLEHLRVLANRPNVVHTKCDRAVELAESCIALPMWSHITTSEIERVVQTLKKVLD